jgi:hypothetical protein
VLKTVEKLGSIGEHIQYVQFVTLITHVRAVDTPPYRTLLTGPHDAVTTTELTTINS